MSLRLSGLSLAVPGRLLLDQVDLSICTGEMVAIVGPSGVGKTSLLNCISGMSLPADGTVIVNGVKLSELTAAKRSAFRLRQIGLVFQFAELLPEVTALQNVALPSRLMGASPPVAEKIAATWLDRLDLGKRSGAHPDQLSGGEQQRVGLARALAHEPTLLLADEPTGMLDEQNTRSIAGLLTRAAREWGAAVLLATHDPAVTASADRVFRMIDAELVCARHETTQDVPP